MKKILLSIIALGFACHSFAQDSTVYKLNQLVNAYADAGRFNGSILIAKQGKILLQKGVGIRDAKDNSMNDENTVYQVASVTKQFTAAVVLKLIELKKMALTDKLSKYYTGFPNGDSITVYHLLTHTSGLHNFTEADSSIQETDEKRMVPYLKTLKPDFKPGTGWHYSNSGYVMLGYIIGKVSGMSYWQAVRKYIFIPLGMTSSGFDFAHLNNKDKAIGYDVLDDTLKQPAVITDSTVPFGAGAIYSTVKDLYKWHQGLQAYKVVGKALMDKAYMPCAQSNYGFGWQIDSMFGKKVVSHSGSISGFGSNLARVMDYDVFIAVLSNKGGSTQEAMGITNKLLAILYNQPYSTPVKRIPVVVSDSVLKRYTGKYEIAEMNLTIDVFMYNGAFIAQPYRDGHPGMTATLLALDNHRFYIKNDEETETTFDVDNNGVVHGLEILQMGTKRYAKKIQ